VSKKRERALTVQELDYRANGQGGVWGPRPKTVLEQMMTEAPNSSSTPVLTLEETGDLKEALADAFDSLDDEDRWIMERLLIEGLSLRKTGNVIGVPKTTLARRRDRLKQQLMLHLSSNESVQDYISSSG
jgi:DNA-directed RNA polymerase specialized sigma24 family protein